MSQKFKAEAQHSVDARFRLRDEVLAKELDELAARVSRSADVEKTGIKLRLICESDMNDRAQMAWAAIKKVHEEIGGSDKGDVKRLLLDVLTHHMRRASLSLAQHLRVHAEPLEAQFRGERPVDAEYIYRLRRDATEKQAKSVEEYAMTVRGGVRSLLQR